jgi:hypothetical protein
MHPTNVIRKSTGLVFYISVIALVAGVWRFQGSTTQFFSTPSDAPSEWQQMGIQVASETTRLLITLGTALLGGLGLFLGNINTGGHPPRHLWAALVSAMGAGVSLYFGYVVHLHVLWMINNKVFDPASDLFLSASHWQFYALLVGAFFFGDFAVNNLSETT